MLRNMVLPKRQEGITLTGSLFTDGENVMMGPETPCAIAPDVLHNHPDQHSPQELKLIFKDMRRRNLHADLLVFWIKSDSVDTHALLQDCIGYCYVRVS